MKLLKQTYYKAAQSLPLPLLIKWGGNSSLFPYHHIVSDDVVPHIGHLYPYKNVAQFTADLETLLRFYEPIEPLALWQYITQHGKLPKRRFLLTFDDGFRETHDIIAPILKAKGVPAIFFINPAFIDNKQMFYRCKISLILHAIQKDSAKAVVVAKLLELTDVSYPHIRQALLHINQTTQHKLDEVAASIRLSFDEYLTAAKPWLTTTQVQSLTAQGFTIGGHSWNHPYYQSLSLKEQLSQTLRSCSFVAQTAPQAVHTFSFPHTDAGLPQNLFDSLLQPHAGINLLFGTQNQKQEINNQTIHRFNAERPHLSLRQQLPGLLLHNMLRGAISKSTIARIRVANQNQIDVLQNPSAMAALKETVY